MAKPECRPLVEPVAVQDVFVSGIASIEAVGPCARFTLFVDSRVPEAGGAPCRNVVVKVILPLEALPTCIRQAIVFAAAQMLAPANDDEIAVPVVH